MYFFIVYNLPPDVRNSAIAELTALLAGNRILHNIAVRLPLAHIAQAHDLVESGQVRGNVVLEIG